MFPDGMIHRSSQDRMRYAQVLVYIAAADGALVREEIAMIESMMGKAMMSFIQEVRSIRNRY